MGGAVYISSCQHTEEKIWKENCVVWIALEPWLNACPCMPLIRVFQTGGWEILVGGFNLYDGGKLRSDFGHSNLFQGLKKHSVNIEHGLNSKLGGPVCTKSMKLK